MKTVELYTKEDKEKHLGKGPWVDEPDEVSFEHADMQCLITRVILREPVPGEVWFGGHLCGYVIIPEYHPLFGCKWGCNDLDDFDVHGGITYSDFFSEEGFMIGFDCGHSRDVVPSMESIREEINFTLKKDHPNAFEGHPNLEKLFQRTYRDIPCVIQECKKLAEQVSTFKLTNKHG